MTLRQGIAVGAVALGWLVASGWPVAAADPVTVTIVAVDKDNPARRLDDAAVFVDGRQAGTTNADGRATLRLPAGVRSEVVVSQDILGSTINLLPTDASEVVMRLSGEGSVRPVRLRLREAPSGILSRDTATGWRLSARTSRGLPDAFSEVVSARLFARKPGERHTKPSGPDFAQLIAVDPDGSLRLTPDAAFLRRLTALDGGIIQLNVVGSGPRPLDLDATVDFVVGKHRLDGRLVVPSGGAGVSTAGIKIVATIPGSTIRVEATTDRAGAFAFPALPRTPIQLDVEMPSRIDGSPAAHSGHARFTLDGDARIALHLLNSGDVARRVAPFVLDRLSGGVANPPPSRVQISAAELNANPQRTIRDALRRRLARASACVPTTIPQIVSVSAAEVGVPQTVTAQLEVPKGTKFVQVNFLINSMEPTWRPDEIAAHNDTWAVRLTTPAFPDAFSGELTMGVAEMGSGEFAWTQIIQNIAFTSTITRSVDVSSETRFGPITATLTLEATSVGDPAGTTGISGWMSIQPFGFKIEVEPPQEPEEHGPKYPNAENVISLAANPPPYPAATPQKGSNGYTRRLKVIATNLPAAKLPGVKVFLVPGNGDQFLATSPILTENDFWAREFVPGQPNLMYLDVTSEHEAFPLGDEIAPEKFFRDFQYRAVFSDSSENCEGEALSVLQTALYRAPPWTKNQRTGKHEERGGDDWSAPAMYRWLQKRRDMEPTLYFNDVSGDHGHNIEHQTHDEGLAVDVHHFAGHKKGQSGSDNYKQLAKLTRDYFKALTEPESKSARKKVQKWVRNQRDGLKKMLADADVEYVYIGYGKCFPCGASNVLKAGWLWDLVTTGKTVAKGGKALNIGGMLKHAHLTHKPGHEDHNHIRVKNTP